MVIAYDPCGDGIRDHFVITARERSLEYPVVMRCAVQMVCWLGTAGKAESNLEGDKEEMLVVVGIGWETFPKRTGS